MSNDEKNVVATLGTGHGKSVIILALATALFEIDKKLEVYIVTINKFLKLYGKIKYGKGNKYVIS